MQYLYNYIYIYIYIYIIIIILGLGGDPSESIVLELESGDRISSPIDIFRLASSDRDKNVLFGMSLETQRKIDELLLWAFQSKFKVGFMTFLGE